MEKCARCKNPFGWKKMHCHEVLNEWLCAKCEKSYHTFFEKFKQEFLNDNDSTEDKEASKSS